VHGVNERVSVRDYATSVGFFARLIRSLDKLENSVGTDRN
jgi:acetylornithine deacetylase/succinyl-diaminopimelate desuccinylase-like protein